MQTLEVMSPPAIMVCGGGVAWQMLSPYPPPSTLEHVSPLLICNFCRCEAEQTCRDSLRNPYADGRGLNTKVASPVSTLKLQVNSTTSRTGQFHISILGRSGGPRHAKKCLSSDKTNMTLLPALTKVDLLVQETPARRTTS